MRHTLVDTYEHFEGTCCYLQGRRINHEGINFGDAEETRTGTKSEPMGTL
jgi:hypothetical protein